MLEKIGGEKNKKIAAGEKINLVQNNTPGYFLSLFRGLIFVNNVFLFYKKKILRFLIKLSFIIFVGWGKNLYKTNKQ